MVRRFSPGPETTASLLGALLPGGADSETVRRFSADRLEPHHSQMLTPGGLSLWQLWQRIGFSVQVRRGMTREESYCARATNRNGVCPMTMDSPPIRRCRITKSPSIKVPFAVPWSRIHHSPSSR